MPEGFASTALTLKTSALVAVVGAVCLAQSAFAGGETTTTERVRGYFCDAKADQIAFLNAKARGESEIMAANIVNKRLARMSCAPYLPATAVPTGDHTVMDGGLVYKLQSYVFLPEKVERWSGTVLGSLQAVAKDQEI